MTNIQLLQTNVLTNTNICISKELLDRPSTSIQESQFDVPQNLTLEHHSEEMNAYTHGTGGKVTCPETEKDTIQYLPIDHNEEKKATYMHKQSESTLWSAQNPSGFVFRRYNSFSRLNMLERKQTKNQIKNEACTDD